MTEPRVPQSPENDRNQREALSTFFQAHRPIPCTIWRPDERAHWYACTCDGWASKSTAFQAEHHHISEFEKHMADALLATGWRVIPPAPQDPPCVDHLAGCPRRGNCPLHDIPPGPSGAP